MKLQLYVAFFASLTGSALVQSHEAEKPFDKAAWEAEFKMADKNGDGVISREEALAANPNLGTHFNVIDTDGDGFISPAEDMIMMQKPK